jgi:rubrerythrin
MSNAQTTLDRIRTDGPVKNTLHNVIQLLSTKLDSAARYGLYQDDARVDGYDDCATLFSQLAEQELLAIDSLKTCLRNHADEL